MAGIRKRQSLLCSSKRRKKVFNQFSLPPLFLFFTSACLISDWKRFVDEQFHRLTQGEHEAEEDEEGEEEEERKKEYQVMNIEEIEDDPDDVSNELPSVVTPPSMDIVKEEEDDGDTRAFFI